MKRVLLGMLASVAVLSAANAADLPVKALGQYPTVKCGFYYGINAEGGAGNVPNAPAGTVVVGGDIGGLVGYACPIGGFPFFVEAIADFQNLNAGNAGFSLSGPAHLEQRAGFQTPLLQLMPSLGFGTGLTPQPIGPLLPPGATAGVPVNYVYGAMNEDDISSQFGLHSGRSWLISPEVGTGLLIPVKLANGTPIVADTYAGYELQSNAQCIGMVQCPKLGQRLKVGVSFKY